MIIIDSREQRPLWNPNQFKVKIQKLDEGDYTTEELFNKAHAERKSGIDLYGSLIQNHKRFAAEIQRAIEKDLNFAVFVECSKEDFVAKKFDGGYRLYTKSDVLTKIVETFLSRYPIEFIWCKDRDELKHKMCVWFAEQREEFNIPAKAIIKSQDSVILKIGDFETEAERKDFSTGNTGYGYYGKVEIHGRMHQISFNAVNLEV